MSVPLPRQRVRVPMPVQTPMTTDTGTVSVPWLYYLMQFADQNAIAGGRMRTLLVKDSTVGDNIADNVPVLGNGYARRLLAVLRVAITADLTVRVKLNGSTLITMTIPAATAVGTVLESEAFTVLPQPVTDKDVLSYDITASDGQIVAAGVASFTFEWVAELWP